MQPGKGWPQGVLLGANRILFYFMLIIIIYIEPHWYGGFFFPLSVSAGCGGGEIQWLSRTSAASQQGQMAFYNWCNPSPGDGRKAGGC